MEVDVGEGAALAVWEGLEWGLEVGMDMGRGPGHLLSRNLKRCETRWYSRMLQHSSEPIPMYQYVVSMSICCKYLKRCLWIAEIEYLA